MPLRQRQKIQKLLRQTVRKDKTEVTDLRRFFVLFALSALLTLCSGAAVALPLTSEQVAQMVQECPTLDEYEDVDGIIWHRDAVYSGEADGSMLRQMRIIVLADAEMDVSWLQSLLFVPAGGRLELEQAAIFDPISAYKIADLQPRRSDWPRQGWMELDFPAQEDAHIIVLSFRQYFPYDGQINDMVWFGSSYPLWEGSIRVRLRADQEFFQFSSTGEEASTYEEGSFRWYQWFYFKQPANRGSEGLLDSSDPFVLFSTSEGPMEVYKAMKVLESYSWPKAPEEFRSMIAGKRGSEAQQAGAEMIDHFWRSSSRIRENLVHIWRDQDQIPARGPWTSWEAIYMVASWLRDEGWSAEVWTQTAIPMEKDVPSSAGVMVRPALLLNQPGGSRSWYYVPGSAGEPGKIPASLRSRTLYQPASSRERLTKRSFGGNKTARNRLSMAWNLQISDEGDLDGSLEVRVRNSWTQVMDNLAEATPREILDLLPGLRGWYQGEEIELKKLRGDGFQVTIPVKARSGIPGGPGVLVGLPSVLPAPFMDLMRMQGRSTLKFPFVVEQEYKIVMPKGYSPLTVPRPSAQGGSMGTYTTEFHHNQRRNVLEVNEKFVMTGTEIESYYVDSFKRLISYWGQWRASNLALVR